MKKTNSVFKTLSIVVVCILLLSFIISIVIEKNKKNTITRFELEEIEMIESYIKKESDVGRISFSFNFAGFSLYRTDNDKLYIRNRDLLNEEGYTTFMDDSFLGNDYKVSYNVRDTGGILITSEKMVTYMLLSSGWSESYYNGLPWVRRVSYLDRTSSEDYVLTLDLTSIFEPSSFDEIKLFRRVNSSMFSVVTTKDGKLAMHDIFYEDNKLRKVNVDLGNEISDINIKKFTVAGVASSRLTVLTDDGNVFHMGRYLNTYPVPSEIPSGNILIGDGLSFEQINYSEINEKVTNIESSTFFDLIVTNENTFSHGIKVYNINEERMPGLNVVNFEKLQYNNNAIVSDDINCKVQRGCFISERNQGLLYYGKYSSAYVEDEDVSYTVSNVDLGCSLVDNEDIDLSTSFSTTTISDIFSRKDDSYYYLNNGKCIKSNEIFDHLKLHDYLRIRDDKYKDVVEFAIVREHFESVLEDLPIDNVY